MATSAQTSALQAAGKQLAATLTATHDWARVVFTPGRLALSASTSEATLTVVVPVDGNDAGEVIVRGSMLTAFLSRAEGTTIELSLGDELGLHSGSGHMDLPQAPTDSWQEITHENEATAEWDGSALQQIARVTHAASTKETDQAMRGVCFLNGKAVATDRNRLAAVDLTVGFDHELVVPASALDTVAKLHDGVSPITICTSGEHFTLRSGAWCFTTTVIVDDFPNWPAVVPAEAPPALMAYSDQLLAALRHVRIVASQDPVNKVQIRRLDDDYLQAWAHVRDVGQAERTFQGSLAIETLAFNLDRLLSAVENLREETVAMEMADARSAAVFRADGYLAVVMPVR